MVNHLKKVRLFVASSVEGNMKAALQDVYRRREAYESVTGGKATWVKPENWHLTWLFLGETEQKKVASISNKLEAALSDIHMFQLCFDDIALWPFGNKPRILALLGEEQHKEAMAVANKIRDCFPSEEKVKQFKPHITLARLKYRPKEKIIIPQELRLEPQVMPVHTIQLFKSTLHPEGAVHESLLSCNLLR